MSTNLGQVELEEKCSARIERLNDRLRINVVIETDIRDVKALEVLLYEIMNEVTKVEHRVSQMSDKEIKNHNPQCTLQPSS